MDETARLTVRTFVDCFEVLFLVTLLGTFFRHTVGHVRHTLFQTAIREPVGDVRHVVLLSFSLKMTAREPFLYVLFDKTRMVRRGWHRAIAVDRR